jgi:hypothetical protein
MSAKRLKAKDVCGPLKVGEQTIYNWSNIGIPKRRWSDVEELMANWRDDASAAPPPGLDQPLIITPRRDQFRAWNRAALAEGMLVEDWAIEGLDRLAAEHFDRQESKSRYPTAAEEEGRFGSLKVAEEEPQRGNGTEGNR